MIKADPLSELLEKPLDELTEIEKCIRQCWLSFPKDRRRVENALKEYEILLHRIAKAESCAYED